MKQSNHVPVFAETLEEFQQKTKECCRKTGLRPVAMFGTKYRAAISGQNTKGYTSILYYWITKEL